jgi:hypothetical protein
MKLPRAALLALVASVALTGAVFAQEEYEYGTTYKTADLLPANIIAGPQYRIADKVQSDGFMFTYTVESDYGRFRATGDYALQKLLNEIQVIAQLEEISRTEAFAKSIVHAAKSPLRFGEGLITDPVDTVTGIPRGLFSIFENVGEAVTSEQDPSEDGRAKQALLVSSWKRDYCAKYDCDVYSSNSVLQEELNRIAWAAAIGGLTVSGATTVASGGAVMVFSTVRMGDQLNEALRAEPPSRLRIINEEKLEAMRVPPDLIAKFLDHPAFTPRHDTLIVAALSRLEGVEGREKFIELCLRAQDEIGANYFQNIAEIMVGYHTKAAKLTAIQPLLGISAATASNGRVLVPVAWDFGVYEQAVAQRMDYAAQEFARRGLSTKFDVWTTGRVSAKLKAEAGRRGFTVVENIERTVPITR